MDVGGTIAPIAAFAQVNVMGGASSESGAASARFAYDAQCASCTALFLTVDCPSLAASDNSSVLELCSW